MLIRKTMLAGVSLPLVLLGGCGGGGGGGAVSSTPTPAPATVPTPAPAPTPTPAPTSFDTAEYRRSNAAVQAQALTAYNAGASGSGVIAGVIDSGLLAANIAEFPRIDANSTDLAGSRGYFQESADGDHGTIVSQVLLGARNDVGTLGLAPGATLLVLRTDTPGSCAVAGADGDCSHNDNAIAAGLDVARRAGAKVVNISLGGSAPNSTLRTAIDRATSAGIIIVIAAGNASGTDPDPLAQVANDAVAHGLVLIAGATDSSRTIASFSGRAGNSADHFLTALGSDVLYIDATGRRLAASGTSFSAPAVSGAIALLAQAFPTMTSAQIIDLLLRTTTDLGAAGTDAVYGRGELNLARAFAPVGATSLSVTAEAVSLTDNATLSGAMGDAASKTGLGALIRDDYAREFAVDLAGTIGRAPVPMKLAGALANVPHQTQLTAGNTTLALSLDARARPDRLTLSQADYGRARALAGLVATRIGQTDFAMGFARGGEALLGGERNRAAFLVADNADGSASIARAPKAAFAVRRSVGGIGVTGSIETGQLRLWETASLERARGIWRQQRYDAVRLAADKRFGPLALNLALTRMDEQDSVLGARFAGALGGNGAATWFADAGVVLTPLDHWRLGAALRRGWTQVPARLGREASTIGTQALAFDVTREAVLGGALSFRWAQPLRVTSGGLSLSGLGLTGLGDATFLSLAPQGREIDLEAAYARPLWRGMLSLNAYRRVQPGNYFSAPDDNGAALRWSVGF